MKLTTALPFALTLGLLAVPATAQQQLLPYLPEDTFMVMSVPDINASMVDFEQMPLAKIWREEEVKKFLADAQTQLQAKFDAMMKEAEEMHSKGAFPVDPKKLMSLRMRGMTFAITKMELKKGDNGPEPELGVMMHMDFGDSAEQWQSLAKMGMDLLEKNSPMKMKREESKVGDTQIITMTVPDAPNAGAMGLNVAMLKNGMLIGTLKDQVRSVLENMQADKKVLSASASYKSLAKHLSVEGAEMEMYMRPSALIDFVMQSADIAKEMSGGAEEVDVAMMKRVVDSMGLRSLQSMGMTCSYVDGKAQWHGYVVSPAPERKPLIEGVLGSSNKVLDQTFLKWVPKDAVHVGAGTLEPMAVYDGIMQAIKASGEEESKKAMAAMEAMEKQMGFSMRDDLCAALGETYAWWNLAITTNPTPPETAMVMKVKDDAKLLKVIRAIVEMTDGKLAIDESEKRGVKSYQLRVTEDPFAGMGMNIMESLTPTFAFKDGYMVAAFNASDIRRVFKMMDRKEDETTAAADIRGNKEFAAYAGQIPKDIQSLSFTDWKAQTESLYQVITSVLAIIPPNEDLPIDTTMLPDAATMTKHMFGALSYVKADAEGYSWTMTHPLGAEVVMPFVMGLVGGMVIPNVMRR
jgi:hypothetical protein